MAARGALLRVEVKERVLHLGRAAAAASAARSTITHDGTFASSLCSNRFWEFPNTPCKSDFPANMVILPPTSSKSRKFSCKILTNAREICSQSESKTKLRSILSLGVVGRIYFRASRIPRESRSCTDPHPLPHPLSDTVTASAAAQKRGGTCGVSGSFSPGSSSKS